MTWSIRDYWSLLPLSVTQYLVFVNAINEGLGALASIFTEPSQPHGQ